MLSQSFFSLKIGGTSALLLLLLLAASSCSAQSDCVPVSSSKPVCGGNGYCQCGYYYTLFSGSCCPCPAGHYCNDAVNDYECPVGTYSGPGQTSCSACPQDSYASSKGSATCTTCPSGTTNQGGGTTSASCCSSGLVYNGYACVACTSSSCSCSSFSQSYCTLQQTLQQCVFGGTECMSRASAVSDCTSVTDENDCWGLSPSCGWIKGCNNAGCINAGGPQPTAAGTTVAPALAYVIDLAIFGALLVLKFFRGKKSMNLLFWFALLFMTLTAISMITSAMQSDDQISMICSSSECSNTSTFVLTLQGITQILPPSSGNPNVAHTLYPMYCPLKGQGAAPPLQGASLLTAFLAPGSMLLVALGYWQVGFAVFLAWIGLAGLCMFLAEVYTFLSWTNTVDNTICGVSDFCNDDYAYTTYGGHGLYFDVSLGKSGVLCIVMVTMGGILFVATGTFVVVCFFNKNFRQKWLAKIVAWCGCPEMEEAYITQTNEIQQSLVTAHQQQANINLQQAGFVPPPGAPPFAPSYGAPGNVYSGVPMQTNPAQQQQTQYDPYANVYYAPPPQQQPQQQYAPPPQQQPQHQYAPPPQQQPQQQYAPPQQQPQPQYAPPQPPPSAYPPPTQAGYADPSYASSGMTR